MTHPKTVLSAHVIWLQPLVFLRRWCNFAVLLQSYAVSIAIKYPKHQHLSPTLHKQDPDYHWSQNISIQPQPPAVQTLSSGGTQLMETCNAGVYNIQWAYSLKEYLHAKNSSDIISCISGLYQTHQSLICVHFSSKVHGMHSTLWTLLCVCQPKKPTAGVLREGCVHPFIELVDQS